MKIGLPKISSFTKSSSVKKANKNEYHSSTEDDDSVAGTEKEESSSRTKQISWSDLVQVHRDNLVIQETIICSMKDPIDNNQTLSKVLGKRSERRIGGDIKKQQMMTNSTGDDDKSESTNESDSNSAASEPSVAVYEYSDVDNFPRSALRTFGNVLNSCSAPCSDHACSNGVWTTRCHDQPFSFSQNECAQCNQPIGWHDLQTIGYVEDKELHFHLKCFIYVKEEITKMKLNKSPP